MIKKFYLFVFAVVMVAIFLCGCLTVQEKGEYALHYEKYPTVSAEVGEDEITFCVDGKDYCLRSMSEEQEAVLKKVLMYTPLSPIVLILGYRI